MEAKEISKLPLITVAKLRPLNPGRHLADVIQGLIENSIDASSTQISIFLENDGLTSIRVIDNGCGISQSSLASVCRFNCTSKFPKNILNSSIINPPLATFGFHGAFLADVSCVSVVNITTRARGNENQHHTYNASYKFNTMTRCVQSNEIAPGTCVEVAGYMYNFPEERTKLMKNPKELNKLLDVVAKYAVAYAWIRFEVTLNDRIHMKTVGNSDLHNNLLLLHSCKVDPLRAFLVSKVDLSDDVSINLFLSNPKYSFENDSHKTCLRAIFLNGKLVSIPSVKNAIKSIYKNSKIGTNNNSNSNANNINNINNINNSGKKKQPFFIMIKMPPENIFGHSSFSSSSFFFDDNLCNDIASQNRLDECYIGKSRKINEIEKGLLSNCQTLITNDRHMPHEEMSAKEIRNVEEKVIDSLKMAPPEAKKYLYSFPANTAVNSNVIANSNSQQQQNQTLIHSQQQQQQQQQPILHPSNQQHQMMQQQISHQLNISNVDSGRPNMQQIPQFQNQQQPVNSTLQTTKIQSVQTPNLPPPKLITITPPTSSKQQQQQLQSNSVGYASSVPSGHGNAIPMPSTSMGAILTNQQQNPPVQPGAVPPPSSPSPSSLIHQHQILNTKPPQTASNTPVKTTNVMVQQQQQQPLQNILSPAINTLLANTPSGNVNTNANTNVVTRTVHKVGVRKPITRVIAQPVQRQLQNQQNQQQTQPQNQQQTQPQNQQQTQPQNQPQTQQQNPQKLQMVPIMPTTTVTTTVTTTTVNNALQNTTTNPVVSTLNPTQNKPAEVVHKKIVHKKIITQDKK